MNISVCSPMPANFFRHAPTTHLFLHPSSVHPSAHPPIYPSSRSHSSAHWPVTYLPSRPPIHLSFPSFTCPSDHPFLPCLTSHLFTHFFIPTFTHPSSYYSIFPSIHLVIPLSFQPFTIHTSLHLSICLPVHYVPHFPPSFIYCIFIMSSISMSQQLIPGCSGVCMNKEGSRGRSRRHRGGNRAGLCWGHGGPVWSGDEVGRLG